jgi:hypothetical protein
MAILVVLAGGTEKRQVSREMDRWSWLFSSQFNSSW